MTTIYETTDRMLAPLQDEVEDSDHVYKIRTVRELVAACRDRAEIYEETLQTADLDQETIDRLRDLGYL